jgi:nucleotidyltransferase substrate binding protein (TIGR01987 family)
MNDFDDIRWKQRFANYRKALQQLGRFVEKQPLNELEQQGLVKAFEYTYELAWNTLKDFLDHQGISGLVGSRDTFRKAISLNLVSDGRVWMQMIESRNKTSHTYNEITAREIADSVRSLYYPSFCELEQRLSARLTD